MADLLLRGVALAASARAGAGVCRLIVPVQAGDAAAAAALTGPAAAAGDLVELRLDALADRSPAGLAAAVRAARAAAGQAPLLVTMRTAREGGAADLCPTAYAEALAALCRDAGDAFDLLDFEASAGVEARAAVQAAAAAVGVPVLFSRHFFRETPPTGVMADLLTGMADDGAAVAKLAVMPSEPDDAARLLEATALAASRRPETPLLTMAMGPAGTITRLCGAAFGCCASFGAQGAASAPGQPAAPALRAALAALETALQGN